MVGLTFGYLYHSVMGLTLHQRKHSRNLGLVLETFSVRILPVAERHADDVAAIRHARHCDALRVDDAGVVDDVPGRDDLVPHLRLPQAFLQGAHQALSGIRRATMSQSTGIF